MGLRVHIRVVRKEAVKGIFASFRRFYSEAGSLKRVLGVIGKVYLMIVRGFGGSKICTLQANRLFIHFTPSLIGDCKLNLQSFSFCLKACQSISETSNKRKV